nr:glycohydrolase toxin TNT-related protein [Gilliamella sp. ESL0250]
MDKDGNWVSDNETARLVSHAILGAVVAELQGNSGLAGGAGAVGGELASKVILDNLYGGKDIKDLTEAEKQNISALTQLVMGLSTAVSGGDAGDISTSIAASKNAVENNGLSWADGGFGGDFIGLSPETGANYEGILHASAAGYLTPEETEQALSDLIKGKGMPNGSDYVELWMRAPEQIGQYLPGPIGTAMAILAATDVAITDTDKANLIQLLTEASKDHLSGSNNTESTTALNMMINRLGAGSTNAHLQSIIKGNVESNVAKTQKGKDSSNFGEHSKLEGKVQEDLGIWPPNSGAYGPVEKVTLKPGATVDRYGYDTDYYISPEGIAFEQRAIPSSSLEKPYKVYKILKPIEDVSQSKVLPWFGQPGQGTQYKLTCKMVCR